MTPKQAIRSLLLADGTIAAALGTRIYPSYPAQGVVKPYAVLQCPVSEVDHHMGGASGLREVAPEFWLYGDDYEDLYALAEQCEAVLDTVNDRTTVGDITISRLWMTDQDETEISPIDGKGRPIQVINQTYGMHYHGN